MAKTIRNQFDKCLTYENLMRAHRLSRKGKTHRREVILFDLKQEEYIRWLWEQLKTGKYRHGGYRVFTITIPKERKVQASIYIDRVVHRWVVDNFLKPYFEVQFINTTYACIKGRGMHKATLDVQKTMKHCKAKCKYYFRYMDDSLVLVKTKEEAKKILEKIQLFLKDKLNLVYNLVCG